ncbi:MAG: methyltransferase [Bacteroidales bacterium]|jgi:tRNA1Val (adenine37-N6)-methyltransferase|nr:methyltransferase [Bacteroidales bacterium]
MRVNTDSVLLGAWATGPSNEPSRILDIGTGCGILALMMAQRFAGARIDALEIDACAAEEAGANVLSSPWAGRISVRHEDFRKAVFTHPYDLVICNPPYFSQSLASPDARRTMARHTSGKSLSHRELIEGVAHLLDGYGLFALILPVNASKEFFSTAAATGQPLYPHRVTTVYTKRNKPAIRILAQMGKNHVPVVQDTIVMYGDSGQEYSPQYVSLVRDFYLWA